MPKNKNAHLRYHTLDKCFRAKRQYTIDDLLDAVNEALLYENPKGSGVEIRQLRSDIKYMRQELEAPIETYQEGKTYYYKYNRKFSINKVEITEEMTSQVQAAIDVLQRFQGMPQFEWVNEVIPQLDQTFGVLSRRKPVVFFEENPFLTGLGYLSPLFDAIQYEKVLSIAYQPFNKERLELVVNPHILKQYNNRWYLFGTHHQDNAMCRIPLDRIQSIETMHQLVYQPSEVNYEDFFDDIIGISRKPTEPLSKVVLKFDKKSKPFVLTKPFHGSQREVSNTEDGLIVRFELFLNYELETQILNFGEQVEVLEPEILRDRIAQRLAIASKQYYDKI